MPAPLQALPAIRFSHVSKSFTRPGRGKSFRAVDDLDLEIDAGTLVAVLGKTGCGKSTMFNMIAGLLAPSEGTLTVVGRDPFRDFDWLRGKIAIVFQNDRLLPWRSAIANVELGLEMLDVPRAERRERARHWLARLGLAGHEHDYPHALSGGMRQRVSIARAFATDAGILLCDEPFSALDEMTAEHLRGEFASLVRENGKTAVFITHSIAEALQIGDRIIVLHRPARIACDAPVARDMDAPARAALRQGIMDVLALEPAGDQG
jgi:NitT/TauT family transport system ATP-binding protein